MGKHRFEGGWAYNGLLFFLELVVQVGSGQGLGEAGRTGPGRQFGGGSYVGWERWRWDRRGTGRVVDGALVRGEDVVCRGRGGNRRRKHLLRGNTTHGGGLSLSCEVVRRWGDRVEMGHAGGGGTLGVAVGGEAGHGICGRHWSWKRGRSETNSGVDEADDVVSVVGCGMSVVGCRLSVVAGRLAVDRCELSTECRGPPRTLGVGDGKSSHFGLPLTPSPLTSRVPRLGSARLQTESSHWKSDQ